MKIILCMVLAILALDSSAQGMPGRGRMGSQREGQNRERPQDKSPVVPSDAFAALERELPSLEVDLVLKPAQLDGWRVFARDVRDVAEMERSKRKHVLSLREQTGSSLIATLAEDERLKNEATQELKRHFDQLYAALDDGQRRTLDRRVVQSQVEPLGR
jgi:hypothetical protein